MPAVDNARNLHIHVHVHVHIALQLQESIRVYVVHNVSCRWALKRNFG